MPGLSNGSPPSCVRRWDSRHRQRLRAAVPPSPAGLDFLNRVITVTQAQAAAKPVGPCPGCIWMRFDVGKAVKIRRGRAAVMDARSRLMCSLPRGSRNHWHDGLRRHRAEPTSPAAGKVNRGKMSPKPEDRPERLAASCTSFWSRRRFSDSSSRTGTAGGAELKRDASGQMDLLLLASAASKTRTLGFVRCSEISSGRLARPRVFSFWASR